MKLTSFFVLSALGGSVLIAEAAPSLIQQFSVEGASDQERVALQSQVALKTPFPSVAKNQLSGALDAKNLAIAIKNVGKTEVLTGIVTDVYAPKSGSIVLLNFAKNYKTAFVGSVKSRNFRRFPNLQTLKGKQVALLGKVVLYKGRPEIELSTPGAIRLVR